MVSGMKELLHIRLSPHATPPSAHSSDCLRIPTHSPRQGRLHRRRCICHVLSRCDPPRSNSNITNWTTKAIYVWIFKSYVLKWRADDAIVFKHSTTSWRSWRCQSWTAESSGRSCKKEEERTKSSNERWWKWRMEPVSMTEIRLLRMNCNMFRLLTPGSTISALSLSSSLANIIAPITEVIVSISSSSRWRPHEVLTTEEYNEYKLLRPFPSPFDWTVENRSGGLTWRNSAVVVAQIKIPVARGTR